MKLRTGQMRLVAVEYPAGQNAKRRACSVEISYGCVAGHEAVTAADAAAVRASSAEKVVAAAPAAAALAAEAAWDRARGVARIGRMSAIGARDQAPSRS
jgi:hypothetical protein